MRLSAFDLSLLLEELSALLVGGFIQNIRQPLSDAVTLEIRQPGESLTLLASADPLEGRLHFISHRMVSPSTPPAFCQFLRATIQGAQIQTVEQTQGDRIIWLRLMKSTFSGYFVVALTGRRANLHLLDAHKQLLRSLRPDHQIVGQCYQLPSPPSDRNAVNAQAPAAKAGHWADRARKTFRTGRFPLSLALEESFRLWEETQRAERYARLVRSNLSNAIRKTRRCIEAMNRDLQRVARYREYHRYGELLKSHVGRMSKGQTRITITDYYDETLPEITIPLNPEKDGPENLKDYFTKYGKFTGAQKNLVPRLQETKDKLSKLQRELQELENMENPLEYKIDPREIVSPKNSQRPRPKTQTATPYRHFRSQDGYSILVGKSAGDNETLTFKVSKPEDLWLHARGIPGSHVIIKLEKKQRVPPETLKDAATLALFYSDLRKSGKGDVIYVLRKNVRKPKQAKPGSVSVTQEKSLWVFVDQARLDRLKGSLKEDINPELFKT